MKRYEIFQADLPAIPGSHVQGGYRPVVIVSNNMANTYSPVVTVIPLTTKLGKKCLPTHVVLLTTGLRNVSIALCEHILTIDKSLLRRYIGYISDPDDRDALDHAMAVQIGLAA